MFVNNSAIKCFVNQVYMNIVAAASLLALLVAANCIQSLKAVLSFRLNQ